MVMSFTPPGSPVESWYVTEFAAPAGATMKTAARTARPRMGEATASANQARTRTCHVKPVYTRLAHGSGLRGQTGARPRRRQQAVDCLGHREASCRRGRGACVHVPGRAHRAPCGSSRRACRARSSRSATSARTTTSRACSRRSTRRSAAVSTSSSTPSPSPRRKISKAGSRTRLRDRFWMAVDISAYSLVACARSGAADGGAVAARSSR